eukprot:scaffold61307_cov42-Prasinocladus_malaysianus.AAC.1
MYLTSGMSIKHCFMWYSPCAIDCECFGLFQPCVDKGRLAHEYLPRLTFVFSLFTKGPSPVDMCKGRHRLCH